MNTKLQRHVVVYSSVWCVSRSCWLVISSFELFSTIHWLPAIFLAAFTTYVREERLISVAEVEKALGGTSALRLIGRQLSDYEMPVKSRCH